MAAISIITWAGGNPGEHAGDRSLAPTDDPRLVQLRAGDERVLETLFRQLADPLAGFARRIGVEASDAEQVVIDVFHDLWGRRATLALDLRLDSYLFRAVRNRALDLLRANTRRARYEGESVAFLEHERALSARETRHEAQEFLEEDDVVTAVRATITTLPESQRTAIYLRYTRELALDEVAAVMHVSVGAVKMLLQRAVRTLRQRVGGVFEPL